MKKLTLLLLLTAPLLYAQSFENQPITSSFGDALDVVMVDMDNDGDIDAVGAAYSGNEVAWFENDGKQNFTKHTIDAAVAGAIYVTVADIDADGDIDIVLNAYTAGATYLFVNDGTQSFTKQTIDASAAGSNYNSIADLNGDGKLDIIAANLDDSEFVWYKNNGSLSFVAQTAISLSGANSVETVDLDGDNHLDLLVTAFYGDEFAWYKNDGTGSFTKHSIDASAQGALTAFPVDLDGDSDLDFIGSISGRYAATGGDEVAWYENDGSQNFTKHSIDASSDYASFGQAADFDLDGDLDIVASATESNELRLYVNDGSQNFTMQVITAAVGDNYSLEIVDIDLDGDMDIIDASPGGDKIRWLANDTLTLTIIPDLIFENYLETHNKYGNVVPLGDITSLGDGIINNAAIPTTKAASAISINVNNLGISDLTGIEDFTSLLYFVGNYNNLTSIDVSNSTSMIQFSCSHNSLVEVDLSQNTALTHVFLTFNALENLNLQNGSNTLITANNIRLWNNPDLLCVQVDDPAYSNATWTAPAWYTPTYIYLLDCGTTIWSGSPASWNIGAPDMTKNAIIDADYVATSANNIMAKSLVVNALKTLTIENTGVVKIENDIDNSGDIYVEKGGSLLQVDNTAMVIGTGVFDVEVITQDMATAKYTYFSSPTQTATMDVFSSWAQMNRNFGWNGVAQDWTYASNPTTAMTPGAGFIVRPLSNAAGVLTNPAPSPATETSFTTNFSGAFNNGVITQSLYYDVAMGDNDNALVGNPYPSSVDTALLMTENTSANALYFWDPNGTNGTNTGSWTTGEYKIWNAGGNTNMPPSTIATGQGFFVVANAPGTLTFSNSMRVATTADTFMKSSNVTLDKIWLNLVSDTNIGSQILIGFNDICTDGFDAQYDATRFNSGNDVSFYSFGVGTQTNNLAIQTRGLLTGTSTTIPLGLTTTAASGIASLTIGIDHMELLENQDIFLLDNLLNVTHNLKVGDYSFTVDSFGALDSRFEILFSRNALSTTDTVIESNDLVIINNEANFNVKMRNGNIITNFKAFDILGKLVVDVNPNANNFDVNTALKQGTILVAKATLESGQVLTKKFIRL